MAGMAGRWWHLHARHNGRDLLSDGVVALIWTHRRPHAETAAWWLGRKPDREVEDAAFALLEAIERHGVVAPPRMDEAAWTRACLLADAPVAARRGMRYGDEVVGVAIGKRIAIVAPLRGGRSENL